MNDPQTPSDSVFTYAGRWRSFFRNRIGDSFDGRIVLEIGCADGALLVAAAARRPRSGFIGLDWKRSALRDAAARVMNSDAIPGATPGAGAGDKGLANVVLIQGRGQDVLRIFGEGEVDEVWVFFPDPCDKPRELANRLICEPFLIDVHCALRNVGSVLALKTDHLGYYQNVMALLGSPIPGEPSLQGGACEAITPAPLRNPPRTPIRRSRLAPPQVLPSSSPAVRSRFEVALTSTHFWKDEAAQAHTHTRDFAGVASPYEHKFIRKKQPIYYVELRTRSARQV